MSFQLVVRVTCKLAATDLRFSKEYLRNSKQTRYTAGMPKGYDQYCPIAHALDLVGERWSLLVVRELMRGPKRYTDLAEALGIGTNILAARLRDLEACGVVTKRTLPPPAASRVYELTDYGRRPEVGHARAGGLGRPLARPADRRSDELFPGWLENAIDSVLAPVAPPGRFEFRVGRRDRLPRRRRGPARSRRRSPTSSWRATPQGLYYLFVDRRLDLVSVQGDHDLLQRLLDAAPTPVEEVAQASS